MLRRTFLRNSVKMLGAVAVSQMSPAAAADDVKRVTVRLAEETPAAVVPEDFCGFGYEMLSIATPGLLSVKNASYLRLVRNLGSRGILRFGGIVADYTHYEPMGARRSEPQDTVITRSDIEEVAAFLHETGWTAIWSVNFGRGTLDEAVVEARDVAAILRDGLFAIELGNEVENYDRGDKPRRKAPYSFDSYLAEYRLWRDAISKAAKGVRFAAPDTAASVDWVEQMARIDTNQVQLLTTHYYRNNQQHASAEQLQLPDPMLQTKLLRLKSISVSSGIPWRMCETNSFSGGGKPGLSDSLLGALWTLDYMLLLALSGCTGVNIETGVNQLGFISSYSPIQDDLKGLNYAGVPYYGMLAFAAATSKLQEIYRLTLDTQLAALTAYALGKAKRPRALIVINRDERAVADVSFRGLGLGPSKAARLSALPFGAGTKVGFAGATVDSAGNWKPVAMENIQNDRLIVEPISAAVVQSTAL